MARTDKLLYEDLTYQLIGAAREVYKQLGSGYLESVYEDALCYELDSIGIDESSPRKDTELH